MWSLTLVMIAALSLAAADMTIPDPEREKHQIPFDETTVTWTSNETSVPSTSASDIFKPSTSASDISKPSTSASDISKPSTSASDIFKPSTSASDISKSSTSASDIFKSSTSASDIFKPSTSASDISKSSTSASDIFKPSTSASDISKSSTSASDISKPSTSASDISKPSTSASGISKPSTSATTRHTSSNRHTDIVEATTIPFKNNVSFVTNCNKTFNSSNSISRCVEQEVAAENTGTQFYLSNALADKMKKVLSYVGFGLCVLALVANSLNIAVFLSQSKTATNTYLISIAALGIVSSATIMISYVYVLVHGPTGYDHYFYLAYHLITISLFVKPVTQRTLYLIVLLVTIERFLVVTFPLKAKEFIFSRFPKMIIMLAVLAVAVFHIFSPLKASISEMVDTTTNETLYRFALSEIYKRDPDAIVTASLASKIIFVYIVLCAGFLTNLMVVFALRRHANATKKMRTSTDTDKAARQERRITVIIITSSLVMLILALPLNIGAVLVSLFPHLFAHSDAPYLNLYQVSYSLSTTLVTVSLSTDFLTYMTLSRDFRQTFLKLLHIIKKNDTKQRHSNGQTQVSTLDTKP